MSSTKASRKRRGLDIAGPPKPPSRVIAERIISILEMPWREPGIEYFYIQDEQLVDDDAGADIRIGISRTGFALPWVLALSREVEDLLNPPFPFQNLEMDEQYDLFPELLDDEYED